VVPDPYIEFSAEFLQDVALSSTAKKVRHSNDYITRQQLRLLMSAADLQSQVGER